MNAETLHAIDALYLENFLDTLLYASLDARSELRACLRQAQTLSGTEYLSPDCRSRYELAGKRLAPLVSELEEIVEDIRSGGALSTDCEPLVQWESVENIPDYEAKLVVERLELAERELITTLNHIGSSLCSTPGTDVSWASKARVKSYLKLKSIPERTCYQDTTMVRFCVSPPYQTAHYFAELPAETNTGSARPPWLLDSEFVSLTTLPLFEDIEIELEVRGEMTTSGNEQNKRRPHVGKL